MAEPFHRIETAHGNDGAAFGMRLSARAEQLEVGVAGKPKKGHRGRHGMEALFEEERNGAHAIAPPQDESRPNLEDGTYPRGEREPSIQEGRFFPVAVNLRDDDELTAEESGDRSQEDSRDPFIGALAHHSCNPPRRDEPRTEHHGKSEQEREPQGCHGQKTQQIELGGYMRASIATRFRETHDVKLGQRAQVAEFLFVRRAQWTGVARHADVEDASALHRSFVSLAHPAVIRLPQIFDTR